MEQTPPVPPKSPQEPFVFQGITKVPDGKERVLLGSGMVTALLGEGGVAIVYEIWNERLGIKRAVKLLRPNYTAESRARFETEMKLLAQLRHPNIIEIHAVGEWNGLPYIEMERIHGLSLYQILRSRGPFPAEVVTGISIMAARALSFTHNCEYQMNDTVFKGILHRDLKPANIMISREGIVKLMDYGIATPTNVSMHTVEGTVVGSLNYISPEQIAGKEIDGRTDLYSFGCVLYEMVTGRKAFPQRTMAELIPAKIKGIYRPLSTFSLKIPGRLRNVITRCMSLPKEKRFESTATLLIELEKIHKRLTPLTPEETVEFFLNSGEYEKTIIRSRRRLRYGIAIAAAAAFVFFGSRYAFIGWARHSKTKNIVAATRIPEKIVEQQNEHGSAVSLEPEAQHAEEREIGASVPMRSAQSIKELRPTYPPERHASPKPASISKQASQLSTFLDSLRKVQGTDDLMLIFSREVKNDRAATALRVYDSLSPDLRTSPLALLLKMRALAANGNRQMLSTFFSSYNVADIEFCLAKGQFFYQQNRYETALHSLANCSSTNAELGVKSELEKEILYFRALCFSRLWETQQSEDRKKQALDSWFDIKYAFRTQQDHEYFGTANEYIRRLTSTSD